MKAKQALLFDWGDTVMRVFPDETGAMANWRRVAAMPGLQAVLEGLHGSAELALATNAVDSSAAAIRRALARAGLDDLFDRVYCFRDVGHRKPSLAFFEAVLQDLGISPHDAFMIGDDFESDVVGANAAGLAAVWYAPHTTEQRTGERYRTIHAYAELPEALAALGFDPAAAPPAASRS